jgi:hypothetical protein
LEATHRLGLGRLLEAAAALLVEQQQLEPPELVEVV